MPGDSLAGASAIDQEFGYLAEIRNFLSCI
jgi:hypothetical protein